MFGANLSQTNFLGTGNKVSIAANRSDIRNSVTFSFTDPYYTIDGVSRGYSLYYQETNIEDDDVISVTPAISPSRLRASSVISPLPGISR